MNKAKDFFYKTLKNFDVVLCGSEALKYHNKDFRESNDIDIATNNTEFIHNFLENLKSEQFEIIEIIDDFYDGLLEFRLKFKDESYVDFIKNDVEFEIIDKLKIAKLSEIVKSKFNIMFCEIEKENARIEVIKKHYNDLKFLNKINFN